MCLGFIYGFCKGLFNVLCRLRGGIVDKTRSSKPPAGDLLESRIGFCCVSNSSRSTGPYHRQAWTGLMSVPHGFSTRFSPKFEAPSPPVSSAAYHVLDISGHAARIY